MGSLVNKSKNTKYKIRQKFLENKKITKNQNNCKNCILNQPNYATGMPCHFKIENNHEIIIDLTTKEMNLHL